jgi:nitrite reductase/ring-hydroxylating ferredoxin subunit
MSSRYPMPPFPDGWFLIEESEKLQGGEVRPIRYFGQDLVLFRNELGAAVILDAHCPHMGAHIGFGGTVEGSGVRCPFHNWLFGADGKCADVPYSPRPTPPDVGIRAWDVAETGGLIFACHNSTGTSANWQLPERPEWGRDGWLGYESISWKVKMHTQEVAENVPDTSHFLYVHTVPTLPVAEVEIDRDVYRQNSIGRTEAGIETWRTRQEAFGLGLIWLTVEGPPAIRFLTAVTPIDDEYVELRLLFLVHEGSGATELSVAGRTAVDMIITNTARELPIWENKVYRERPHLVPGDGPIGRLRHWAKQFYPTGVEASLSA